MKTRIIDSEKRKAFEQSWKRDQYRHPQGDIAKFNACFFANAFVSELEGENGASLDVEPCFLDFDQCCGRSTTGNNSRMEVRNEHAED